MPPRRKRAKPPQDSTIPNSQELNKPSSNASHPIHRLPNELLLEIFYQHVWVNFDTPVRLVLVCRLWNVVGSFPALWGNIFFGNGFYWSQLNEEDGLCYRMDGMIYCSDKESLDRAIARTGSSKFELTMCMSYDSNLLDQLDEPAPLSRCRLIRFINPYTLGLFTSWMGSKRFPALEELLILGRYGSSTSFTLLAKLREGSPHLWNLSITVSDTTEFHESIRGLLPRLKKLSLDSVSAMQALIRRSPAERVAFPNLEELIICPEGLFARRRSRTFVTIHAPMPVLKRVTLGSGSLRILSADIYNKLTHLTLLCGFYWDTYFEGVIKLPLLTYLALHGSWKNIVHLDAPNLITLILQNATLMPVFAASEVEKISLLPEILHIDNASGPNGLSRFLNHSGKSLKALFITHVKLGDTISETLASDLTGTRRLAAICPLLQSFDLLTPESSKLDTQKATRNRLQNVINSRVAAGHLQRVRYGYYHISNDKSETLEYASRKWWTVEWNELLMR